MASTPVTSLDTTSDERTMAVLAHALQVVGWWIAPLIIFVIKRDSKFVSFHALQALLLQIAYMVLMGVFMVVWFAGIFAAIAMSPASKNGPPPPFVFLMPLIWLGWMGMWVVMLVISIIYAVKAGQGEWAGYPILGKVARRILKLDVPATINA
jgi:uncharacterized protein